MLRSNCTDSGSVQFGETVLNCPWRGKPARSILARERTKCHDSRQPYVAIYLRLERDEQRRGRSGSPPRARRCGRSPAWIATSSLTSASPQATSATSRRCRLTAIRPSSSRARARERRRNAFAPPPSRSTEAGRRRPEIRAGETRRRRGRNPLPHRRALASSEQAELRASAARAARAGLRNRSVRSSRDISRKPRRRAAISNLRPIIQA